MHRVGKDLDGPGAWRHKDDADLKVNSNLLGTAPYEDKAGLHNVPQCQAGQPMLKVAAPTLSGGVVHVCLID